MMKKMIVEASIEDAGEILQIQKLAYVSEAEIDGNYEIEPLLQTIEDVEMAFSEHVVLKLVLDGKTIGSVRAKESAGTCHIMKLMVHPDFQGRGFGKELMNEIERRFTGFRFELFTGSKSERNIRFYKNLGYGGYKTERLPREETMFLFMEKTTSLEA
ncbi:GNAT family N-acetyltransferase [Rossellomorea aquimaris]|uniref:GNAT family N-acetyltransferase n=1 Tax=Rossellomorea aquimaris TaxID=189382 RepID=UPI001CD296DE|nr:GNAT family N-acetyltransferase [Rossellomorea aquimaris]MCA1053808.1 GNAT family N-acetyltransferase [Rossellomorea aquimaris]